MAYHTYHCLCTELIVAVPAPLEDLPHRGSDKSSICTTSGSPSQRPSELGNVTLESKATVLKLADGFEKRFAVSCARCGLAIGYQLDKSQFGDTQTETGCREDVVYFLPGGLLSTSDMQAGRSMEKEIQLTVRAAG